MDAEDLVVDDGGDREAIEALDEFLPKFKRVASLALIVEAIDTIDRTTLMVTSQQEEILGVLDLVRQQQADHLEILLSSINIVAKEQIV